MRNKLPVYLENRELPEDNYNIRNNENSYGYVNVLYLTSIIITALSVATVMLFGK